MTTESISPERPKLKNKLKYTEFSSDTPEHTNSFEKLSHSKNKDNNNSLSNTKMNLNELSGSGYKMSSLERDDEIQESVEKYKNKRHSRNLNNNTKHNESNHYLKESFNNKKNN